MEIVKNGENIIYAIHVKASELTTDKTEWFSKQEYGVQVAGFNYNKDKEFKAHFHKERERSFNRTQEVMIVISGKLLAKIYDNNNELISCFNLEAGDIGIFLQGGHGYRVLEDNTLFYEIKNGPFGGSVLDDKGYIE